MECDHCLIYFNFKLSGGIKPIYKNVKSRLNFSKADWILYKCLLVKAIKELKITSSLGSDQIHNLLLKNIPYDYIKKLIYRLVNLSIENC